MVIVRVGVIVEFMEIKLRILIANLVKLKRLCLVDFKLRRKFPKTDCCLRHVCLSVRLQQMLMYWRILYNYDI